MVIAPGGPRLFLIALHGEGTDGNDRNFCETRLPLFGLDLAKFCDSLANGGKHRLQVDRRARDDLENVTGRGLIIESLLVRPRLHLLEQPRILDRDHRLVGKGFQQLDLRFGDIGLGIRA
jgi:hypothetical protein